MLKRQLQIALTVIMMSCQPAAVLAQSFTVLPSTPAASLPQVPVQPAAAGQPAMAVPQFLQPQILIHTGGTILPTDSLSRPVALRESASRSGRAQGRERVVQISDLQKFLRQHGWERGVAEPFDSALFSGDVTTIDTDLVERIDDRLIPISFITGQEPAPPVAIRLTSSCPEVAVFSAPNQYLAVGRNGRNSTIIVGETGTVVSHKESTVALYDGSIVIDTGAENAVVITRAGAVKIEPQSTALIDSRDGKRLAVLTLAGKGVPLKVKLAVAPDERFELAAGESLFVDMASARGAADAKVETFDATALSGRIRGMLGSGNGLISRLGKHLQGERPGRAESAGWQSRLPMAKATHLLGSEGARLVVSRSGEIGLASGRILIDAAVPQIVRTQLGDTYLQAHALAAVERWQGQMRVFCLSEPDSAIMVVERFGIPLQWGEEALVTEHEPTVADMLPQDDVGRRAFEIHKLNRRYCSLADFSLRAVLCRAPHLHSVREPATRAHAALRSRLMKTAASLEIVTAAKGKYYLPSELASGK